MNHRNGKVFAIGLLVVLCLVALHRYGIIG